MNLGWTDGLLKPFVVVVVLAAALLGATALWSPSGAFGQAGNSLSVTGLGTSGNEELRVRVDGTVVSTIDLTTQSQTHTAQLPAGTTWGQIELFFADGPNMDVTLTRFALGSETRSMVSGDVLVSGQWVGTCSSLAPPVGSTIYCTGVVQFPDGSGSGGGGTTPGTPPDPNSPLDRSYWGNANTVVPVYDTAWDMGVQVTLAEGREYMDYVQNAGFSGFATTYLGAIHRPAARTDQGGVFTRKDPLGNPIATWDDATGNLIMDPGHADHFEDLLDEAHNRGLRVLFFVFWERKSIEEYGLINEGNAYSWAYQIGSRFKDHPAIQTWTLGGDAGVDDPRTQLWTNAVAGLRDAGVTGDINFGTGSAPARRLNQINAPWNTGQLVQTSHCGTPALVRSRLQRAIDNTNIPVWAGEMRYEGINATWCNPAVTIPQAQDIIDDAEAALDVGAAAILYGHNERWQWGHGLEGSTGRGFQSVRESFSAPGAFALIDYLTVNNPTPTTTTTTSTPATTTTMPTSPSTVPPTPTTTAPTTTAPTPTTAPPTPGGENFTVSARGTTGTELIQVRINGFTHTTINLTNTTTNHQVTLPAGTTWDDIELFFGDGPLMDVIYNSFTLNNQTRTMTTGDVLASGQWINGQGCSTLGNPIHSTIHCRGTVEFPTNPTPTTPTTTAPTPTTPTTTPPGSGIGNSLAITGRGTTGTEILQVRVNGFTADTVTFSRQSTTQIADLPAGTSWDDIELFFGDGPLMDVILDSFVLGGETRTMVAGDVLVSGQWTRTTGCTSLGAPLFATIHCRGTVEFP